PRQMCTFDLYAPLDRACSRRNQSTKKRAREWVGRLAHGRPRVPPIYRDKIVLEPASYQVCSAGTLGDVVITTSTDHDGAPFGSHLHRFFSAFTTMSQLYPN